MQNVHIINSFEELLQAIAEDLLEAEAKKQEGQGQQNKKENDEFDTCVKISKIITNLEFIIQELKNIRTKLSK